MRGAANQTRTAGGRPRRKTYFLAHLVLVTGSYNYDDATEHSRGNS